MTLRFSILVAIGLTLIPVRGARAGQIAYWSANGNALDSSGNGNNGTLENGAGYGPGVIGQAFQFDGANQYVSVPNSPAWSFGSGSFTIGLWANFSTINQGPLGLLPNVFIADDDGGGPTDKWVFYYDGEGHLAFHINNTSSNETFLTPTSTFIPATNSWNYYAITRSGSTFTFYVDGQSLGTATSSQAVPTVTAPLTIGESENLGYFDGSLEQISIYNQALTASQIQQLGSLPEPASLILLGLGGLGLGIFARRHNSTGGAVDRGVERSNTTVRA